MLSHELKLETQIAAQPTAIAFALSAAPRRPVYESAGGSRSSCMQIEGCSQGFTLIELSIVLIIIGLIVGGILVGADLINAAAIRAQITQIEKYNTAVHTFQNKYGGLPGDLSSTLASQFGFNSRPGYAGQGDGNGVIQGSYGLSASDAYGTFQAGGETVLFWQDLGTYAGPIDFKGTTNGVNCCLASVSPPSQYFPSAKIGNGNYICVWSPVRQSGLSGNYFSVSAISGGLGGDGNILSVPGMSVLQASRIDTKIDDGLPQSGNVIALYISDDGIYNMVWANGTDNAGIASTGAIPPTTSTCYDNGSGSGAQQYSLSQNGGSGINCGLSFRFQ